MATISARVSVNVYGQVFGQAPYIGTNSGDAFTRLTVWDSPQTMSFPTSGTIFHPVSPGQRVGNSSNYIYSVIEVQPTGLNVEGDKFASNQSVTTLATGSQIS